MNLQESIANLRAEAQKSVAIKVRITTAQIEDGTLGIDQRLDEAKDLADDLAAVIDIKLASIATVRLQVAEQIASLLGGRPFLG